MADTIMVVVLLVLCAGATTLFIVENLPKVLVKAGETNDTISFEEDYDYTTAPEKSVADDLSLFFRHGLVCGKSGSGKGEFITRLILVLLAAGYKVFVLDHKGGLDYSPFVGIPTFTLWRKIGDDNQIDTGLAQLQAEAARRTELFFNAKVRNLTEYQALFGESELDRLFVISDEVADFTDKQKAILTMMLRQYRAVGIHQILSTQRPTADAMPHAGQSQTSWRVVLKVKAKDKRYACNVNSDSEVQIDPSKLKLGEGILIDDESDVWQLISYPKMTIKELLSATQEIKNRQTTEPVLRGVGRTKPDDSSDLVQIEETATSAVDKKTN